MENKNNVEEMNDIIKCSLKYIGLINAKKDFVRSIKDGMYQPGEYCLIPRVYKEKIVGYYKYVCANNQGTIFKIGYEKEI